VLIGFHHLIGYCLVCFVYPDVDHDLSLCCHVPPLSVYIVAYFWSATFAPCRAVDVIAWHPDFMMRLVISYLFIVRLVHLGIFLQLRDGWHLFIVSHTVAHSLYPRVLSDVLQYLPVCR
jgi:hypothetical protein